MARDLDPKCKQCRRAGEKLFLKGERCFGPKCAMTKRNYPPGVHGNKGYPRQTDYGMHLKEKQKLKRMYGIMERQLRKYFEEAAHSSEETGSKLIELLERRLDNVIYRLGLATSRRQARQFVSHDLFKVKDKKIDVPSYRVRAGETITIRKEKSSFQGYLAENMNKKAGKELPSWLSWDADKKECKIVNIPSGKDLEIGIDTRLIVEFYSK